MTLRSFWKGLNPDKPERLDKILAAIHCYQVAPPHSLSDQLYFEFKVDRQDHHRLANKGFPELQKLAQFLGREIPFVFDASTGKLATMTPAIPSNLFLRTYGLLSAQLESAARFPAPAGPLAAKLMVWAFGDDDDNEDTLVSNQKAQKMNTPPRTPTMGIIPIGLGGGRAAAATTFIILTATDSHKSAGKYTRCFTKNPDLRTILVLQFALPLQINTANDMQRLAERSSMTVFTKSDGAVYTTVDRELLFTSCGTGGGAIQLWLSDMVKQEDVKKLSAKFIRGQNHPANINIPFHLIFTNVAHYVLAENTGGGDNVMNREAGNSSKSKSSSSSSSGGGGGKRLFSTFAGGSIKISTRSGLPTQRNNTMLMSNPAVTTATATTTTTMMKPFVRLPRAPHAPGLGKPAGAMGRFLTRLGKW